LGTLGSVKRPVYFVIGIALVAVIAYLVYEYRADFGLGGSRGGPAGGNAGGAQMGWQTVDRSADGFKVQMPATPGQTEVPAYTGGGVMEQVEMIEASVDPDTTYAVAWADNPPVEQAAGEDAGKTLDMARDGALGRTQTTLVAESRNERNGRPSRDVLARNASGGILNARLILAGTRLYMLITTFPSASARRDADVDRFFNSFTMTAAASASQ